MHASAAESGTGTGTEMTGTPPAETISHTPLSIMNMSGLKPILLASSGLGAAYMVGAVAVGGDLLVVLGVFVLGVFYWTFLEYILHRWMLHWEPEEKRLRLIRDCFPSHAPHHRKPLNERKYVWHQVKMTVALSLVYTAFMCLFIPFVWSLALNAGVLLGYQAYEYVHTACHQLPMRKGIARTLKRHHAIHHHRDDRTNFGVTTTMWDHVFRTNWKPSPRGPGAEPAVS